MSMGIDGTSFSSAVQSDVSPDQFIQSSSSHESPNITPEESSVPQVEKPQVNLRAQRANALKATLNATLKANALKSETDHPDDPSTVLYRDTLYLSPAAQMALLGLPPY